MNLSRKREPLQHGAQKANIYVSCLSMRCYLLAKDQNIVEAHDRCAPSEHPAWDLISTSEDTIAVNAGKPIELHSISQERVKEDIRREEECITLELLGFINCTNDVYMEPSASILGSPEIGAIVYRLIWRQTTKVRSIASLLVDIFKKGTGQLAEQGDGYFLAILNLLMKLIKPGSQESEASGNDFYGFYDWASLRERQMQFAKQDGLLAVG